MEKFNMSEHDWVKAEVGKPFRRSVVNVKAQAESSLDHKAERNVDEYLIQEYKKPELFEISATEADDVMSKLEIHATPYRGDRLTTQDISQSGQEPRFSTVIGNRKIYLAKNPYRVADDRRGILAFVEDGDKYIARTYYLSNSSASWRYLPEYMTDDDGSVAWYGKGYHEDSLNLPLSMQKVLASLSGDQTKDSDLENSDLILAGTARKTNWQRNSDESYYGEIKIDPDKLPGNFYGSLAETVGLKKIPPEQLVFSRVEFAPDFSKVLDSWVQSSLVYGSVAIEVFSSKNKLLQYAFGRDSLGRAWLYAVENNSPIASNGLHSIWLDAGELATPAFEYKTQSGQYGNASLSKGNYVDMFKNYLSKVPVIQEYLRVRSPKIKVKAGIDNVLIVD